MYVTRHLCLSEQAHNAEANGSLINMYNAEQSQSTFTLVWECGFELERLLPSDWSVQKYELLL